MLERFVEDWDNAYANGVNIPGGDRWPGLWQEAARTYRARMSAAGRAGLDIAYGPEGPHHDDHAQRTSRP